MIDVELEKLMTRSTIGIIRKLIKEASKMDSIIPKDVILDWFGDSLTKAKKYLKSLNEKEKGRKAR